MSFCSLIPYDGTVQWLLFQFFQTVRNLGSLTQCSFHISAKVGKDKTTKIDVSHKLFWRKMALVLSGKTF